MAKGFVIKKQRERGHWAVKAERISARTIQSSPPDHGLQMHEIYILTMFIAYNTIQVHYTYYINTLQYYTNALNIYTYSPQYYIYIYIYGLQMH